MEPQALRDFLAVVKHGGFSAAAEKVPRSQPTLSLSVKHLQDELGIALFERLGRRVKLTPAGEAFRDKAEILLDQLASLARFGQDSSAGVRGPVRVGAGEGGVSYLLPEPVRQFKRRHPEIEVIIRNQPVEESLGALKSGDLDFALRSLESPPRGFDYAPAPALRFDRVVIAPKEHEVHRVRRLTPSALAKYPLVMPWPRSTTRQLVERAFEAEDLQPKVAIEAGGWSTVKRYVELGLGLAIVPAFCVEPSDRRRLITRSVRHLFGQDQYGIVVKHGRQLSRGACELIDLIDPDRI